MNDGDINAIARLCQECDALELIDCSEAEIRSWCADGAGVAAVDRAGHIKAACFFKTLELGIAAGARPAYGTQHVLYLHHHVVAKDSRASGLGRRVGEAAVGLAYATLEGPFPGCVGCTFLDSPSSWQSHRHAGMLVVPQWEASIIDSVPMLRALDTLAWETKARIGLDRAHAVEFLYKPEIFRIARWMTIAFAFPFRDPAHDFTVKLRDPSEGRSNFRRAMHSLACREVTASARLTLENWQALEGRLVANLGYSPARPVFQSYGDAFLLSACDTKHGAVLQFPRSGDARDALRQRAKRQPIEEDDDFSAAAAAQILAPAGFVGHLLPVSRR